MNKSDLINAMAADAGISKAAAKAALESLTDNVTSALKGGGKVALVGWGTWSVCEKHCEIQSRSWIERFSKLSFSFLYTTKTSLLR
jgi:nucleoid DNA-binding protein